MQGDPNRNVPKGSKCTYAPQDESHHTADEPAVAPAGSGEGRPKISPEAPFARSAMIQQETVGASHPIIMQVLNNRDAKIESRLVDGWGQSRQGVLNDPQIKIPGDLVCSQRGGHGGVVKEAARQRYFRKKVLTKPGFAGAYKILKRAKPF
jgi:hypothetical protein